MREQHLAPVSSRRSGGAADYDCGRAPLPRSLQVDKLAQRFEGPGAALCIIAIGLVLIWHIVLTAEFEEQGQEAEEHNLLQSDQEAHKIR